jgi:DNA-binding CsgD family transcriptional regulator
MIAAACSERSISSAADGTRARVGTPTAFASHARSAGSARSVRIRAGARAPGRGAGEVGGSARAGGEGAPYAGIVSGQLRRLGARSRCWLSVAGRTPMQSRLRGGGPAADPPARPLSRRRRCGRAYLRAGDGDSAGIVVRTLRPAGGGERLALAQARAAHLRRSPRGRDDYGALFEETLGLHERARTTFLQARTELAYGERLRRDGLPPRGSRPSPCRVGDVTSDWEPSVGPRRQPPSFARRANCVRRRSDPDTARLTPQELQVELVVAQGVTNKARGGTALLSPEDEREHLGSTYTKLGLSSRAELARLFAGPEPRRCGSVRDARMNAFRAGTASRRGSIIRREAFQSRERWSSTCRSSSSGRPSATRRLARWNPCI